jgi:lactate dehydrogenase-like 2-hydroxyacid dehydrogenase
MPPKHQQQNAQCRDHGERSMSKPTVLMTAEIMPMIQDQLEASFEVHRYDQAADKDALLAEIGDRVVGVCHGGHSMHVDAALMDRLPNMQLVSNFGVGYDGVDTDAAHERGIIVTNTPDVLTEEVADTALGLLIMTVRELPQARDYLHAGRWAKEGDYRLTPNSLRDRSVGIFGLGRIGKAIAKRCEGFGLPVSYFGRNQQDGVSYPYYSDRVALASEVDTLICVTPGTPETQNMVNTDVLKALGSRGILINISRGSVVDEAALMTALKDGTIAAAGLDVMVGEPNINPELMSFDNLVLLPHVASGSIHTRNQMGQLVVDNLLNLKAGKAPISPVPETPFTRWK